jgi:hypothetical protein
MTTPLVELVECYIEYRSKGYVSDGRVFANWIASLKAAPMVERIRILSRDLDGPSEEGELAEKVVSDVVDVEHRPRD